VTPGDHGTEAEEGKEEMGLLKKENMLNSLKKENFELKMRIYLLTENLQLEEGQLDYIEQISHLKSTMQDLELYNAALLNQVREMEYKLEEEREDVIRENGILEKLRELEEENIHLAQLLSKQENSEEISERETRTVDESLEIQKLLKENSELLSGQEALSRQNQDLLKENSELLKGQEALSRQKQDLLKENSELKDGASLKKEDSEILLEKTAQITELQEKLKKMEEKEQLFEKIKKRYIF
jgi:hypothetical protein